MKCPCHSGTNYDKCCGPYHSNLRSPATPLELMRSRYSAYALDLAEYIIETTHPKSPLYEKSRSDWLHYIHEFHKTTTFEGLIIESYDETHVTFFAILKTDSKDTSFREKSLFKKFKGLWRYVRKETPET
jgi:SEC-C motif domain protein